MNNLPIGRTTNIVVQELQNELLVYDLITNKSYLLNQTAAIIYQACNGKTTFAELKTKHKFSDDLIYLSLDGLKKENLIETAYVSPFAGLSRREAIKKVGLASMVTLPIISAMVAPSSISAASTTCTPNICFTVGQDFCSGCPNGTVIDITVFSSSDGSCTGNISESGAYPCTGPANTGVIDIRRN